MLGVFNMNTRVFGWEKSRNDSLRTTAQVLEEDQALREQAAQGRCNLGIEGTSPHHLHGPLKTQSFSMFWAQGGLNYFRN